MLKPEAKATIPSDDGEEPRLGKGLAVQQWQSNFTQQQYQRFINTLDKSIYQLRETFPGRVIFGRVGTNALSPPSETDYHAVWGANAMNWNLREGQPISGGGMAAAMGIQKKGVFGIVTTPQ